MAINPFGEKLHIYPQSVEFDGTLPILKKEEAEFIQHINTEPLQEECAHFLDCIKSRKLPLTDAQSGIEVLKVLMLVNQVLSKMVNRFHYEQFHFIKNSPIRSRG